LGAVAFFFLTDWPRDASWLAPAQRQWISHKPGCGRCRATTAAARRVQVCQSYPEGEETVISFVLNHIWQSTVFTGPV
jgi:hypothetical protein